MSIESCPMSSGITVKRRIRFVLLLLAGLAPSFPGASAQEEGGQPGAEGGQKGAPVTVQPGPDATQRSREELMAAYRQEYAFLEAQQQALERQIQSLESDYQRQQQDLENQIQSLERQVMQLQNRAETLRELTTEAARQAQANAENRELVETTFSQAGATLSEYGIGLEGDQAFQEAPTEKKVSELFERARSLLARLASVRSEPGQFFLPDGTQVEGTIIKVGNIASYGVSDRGAGALAPAGEGELKIWQASTGDDARALVRGESPDPLNMFLYESLNAPVSEKSGQGPIAYVSDGGAIAWLIVALGLLALALIILRAVFLKRASASTDRITEEVGSLVRERRIDEALEECQRHRGATARVMAAAVRNLERDRDHVEDIVSEAILHENGHLNRFGAFILVIAAVAPLLGLLGTVTGMISTFDVITEFGTGDPKLLSGGISIALITTELGLMVAIPTLLLGNLLSGWAERIKNDMEKSALKVINQFEDVRMEQRREAA